MPDLEPPHASNPPRIGIVRHGETEWAREGRHTGLSDVPLTHAGEAEAASLAPRLRLLGFERALTSPLQRARRTCELAGFASLMGVDPDLAEWDYGAFEGLTSAEILAAHPGWELFRDGCPNGESPAQVEARADRVVRRLLASSGAPIVVFSHGHFLRALAVRWLGWPLAQARFLRLDTASLGVLDWDHGAGPVLAQWNCP